VRLIEKSPHRHSGAGEESHAFLFNQKNEILRPCLRDGKV